MNLQTSHLDFGARQRGTALIVSLAFLLLLTILAVTAVSTSTLEEKMSGNLREQQLAFQSAESALRDAEAYLTGVNPPKANFVAACTNGLCLPAAAPAAPVWDTVSWGSASSTSIPYGTGTGATALTNLAQAPRYIIEDIQDPPGAGATTTAPSGSLGVGFGTPAPPVGGGDYYRITARGVGGTPSAQTMVQVIYVK